jgi:hypothetical protein
VAQKNTCPGRQVEQVARDRNIPTFNLHALRPELIANVESDETDLSMAWLAVIS